MPFTPKTWQNGSGGGTPLSAAALIDLETRLSDYTDDEIAGVTGGGGGIDPAIVNAKGDLIAATADNTVARLAVGSNGQVLVAASGQATGLQWATPDVTQAELDAHAADTTAIHGIADTSVLATATSVASAVSTHEADTTAVHGLSSTAACKGVAKHNGTTYPTRPTGFASVEWIGPTDPGGSAVDGDTWIATTP